MKEISGKENTRIKEILKIKKNTSKNFGAFVFIEGLRSCEDAFKSGVAIETLILSENFVKSAGYELIESANEILTVKDYVFSKISSSKTPQGIAAIVKSPVIQYSDEMHFGSEDRYLICESIQDPGNFGSIIRSADAFGFKGVIFTDDNVDPLNEKVIRAAMGSVFHIRLMCTTDLFNTIVSLKQNGFIVYATDLAGQDVAYGHVFEKKCAIVLGNEGNGVSANVAGVCDKRIRIPMKGQAESLNVSNAAAIICYLASQNVI
jgi:TrmH family RNA methyltransferase